MPTVARILTLAGLMAIFGLAASHLRATTALESLPDAIPEAVAPDDSVPSVWVFVRRGCAHCESHLNALARAAGRCDTRRRQALLGRVHVVGEAIRVPAGARREPDRLRRALGVRTTPTTLLVDPRGRVRKAWRGARGVSEWERAFDLLDGRAVAP